MLETVDSRDHNGRRPREWGAALAVGLAAWIASASALAEEPGTGRPRGDVGRAIAGVVAADSDLSIGGARLDGGLARELYAPRDFAPFWVEGADAPARVEAVASVLRGASAEALDPDDYHTSQIGARLRSPAALDRAELDLLLSDAVMRYGVHLRSGAYRPTRTTKEVALERSAIDPVGCALDAAASPDAGAFLKALAPPHPEYRRLREALALYRDIDARGGWPGVPPGPKLEPGAKDLSVRALRERLLASGDLEGPSRRGDVYDAPLVQAVKRFQARHGLAADGVVGERTRVALNVSASERVRQIEMAMERLRWLPEDLGEHHVLINIPAFRLEVRERGATALEMPVIVGKPSWPTPSFSSAITELIFNPPWNVPPKIAREELLPKAAVDEDFFAREGITLRRGVRLAVADTGDVADDGSPARSAHVVRGPVRLRQAPGPKNPLGHVKFNIPNGFDVYLHDTPNKTVFRRSDRALSHGCVRVGDARGLAERLTSDMPGWTESRRAEVMAKWQTKTVDLATPLPVHLVYLTAWPDEAGEIQFRDDVYGRDAALARAWGRPRDVRLPPQPQEASRPASSGGATAGEAEAAQPAGPAQDGGVEPAGAAVP